MSKYISIKSSNNDGTILPSNRNNTNSRIDNDDEYISQTETLQPNNSLCELNNYKERNDTVNDGNDETTMCHDEMVNMASTSCCVGYHDDNSITYNNNTIHSKDDLSCATTATCAANNVTNNNIYTNFVLFCICFSINHSTGLSCLALATSRFGSNIGSIQDSVLYLTYTLSAGLGMAPYIVHTFGTKRAIVMGMYMFSIYVIFGCYIYLLLLRATSSSSESCNRSSIDKNDNNCTSIHSASSGEDLQNTTTIGMEQPHPPTTSFLSVLYSLLAYIGAFIGGIGAGICWTGQGVYFTQASAAYYKHQNDPQNSNTSTNNNQASNDITNQFSSLFAVTILLFETIFDAMATIMIHTFHIQWDIVFFIYSIMSILSTIVLQLFAIPYNDNNDSHAAVVNVDNQNDDDNCKNSVNHDNHEESILSKAMITLRVLIYDYRIKYYIAYNACFGLTGAFLNSFVSGEIVPIVFQGDDSYVGIYVAIHGIVAALSTVIYCYGKLIYSTIVTKGCIHILGSISFGLIGLLFLIKPNIRTSWNYITLLFVYSIQGIGRSTFEGNLKAIFADYYISDDNQHYKEGAFSNIILQYGLASSISYMFFSSLFVSSSSSCSSEQQQQLESYINNTANQVTTSSNHENDAFVNTNSNTSVILTDTNYYCIRFRDGTYHDIGLFAKLIVLCSCISILGYWRASFIDNKQRKQTTQTISDDSSNDVEYDNSNDENDGIMLQSMDRHARKYDTFIEGKTIDHSRQSKEIGFHVNHPKTLCLPKSMMQQPKQQRTKHYDLLRTQSDSFNDSGIT